MGPKINGNSVADLVSKAVERQMGDYKDLLMGALAKITSLEEEIAQCRQNSNPILPITKSSSKSEICRHWLKNQCTWQQRCRFSHDSATTSSTSDSNAKDLEEVATKAKGKVEKSAQVGFPFKPSSSSSKCEIPIQSSEIVECFLNSNLHSRPCLIAGVLQPQLVGAALSYNIVDEVVNHVMETAVEIAKQPAPVMGVTKMAFPVTGPCMPVSEEEEWLEDMVDAIKRLEAKYDAKYKSVEEGGVIHSAQVAVPRVDFSKVKPHLHRKLPKPESVPVQACSNDPTFYTKCSYRNGDCSQDLGEAKHLRCAVFSEHESRTKFTESSYPFGNLPGFVTSLGVVAVPDEQIGGYVYDGGSGDATKWRLHAEAVYI